MGEEEGGKKNIPQVVAATERSKVLRFSAAPNFLLISAQEETAAARCVVASVLPALTEVNKQRVASCPNPPPPPPPHRPNPLGTVHCGTSCWFIFLRSLSAACLSRVRAPSPPSHSSPSPRCPGRIDGALKGLGCHHPSVAGG